MTDPRQREGTPEDRHQSVTQVLGINMNTALTGVAMAIMLWVGQGVAEASKQIVSLSIKVESLQSELASLKVIASDRYTAADARRDQERSDRALGDIQARLRALEDWRASQPRPGDR